MISASNMLVSAPQRLYNGMWTHVYLVSRKDGLEFLGKYIAAAFFNAFLVLSMQSPALSCEWLVRPQEKNCYGEEPERVGSISRPARGPSP